MWPGFMKTNCMWTMAEFLNGAAIPMVRRTYESNIEQVGWSKNNEYLFVRYGQLDRILFESFDIRTVELLKTQNAHLEQRATRLFVAVPYMKL